MSSLKATFPGIQLFLEGPASQLTELERKVNQQAGHIAALEQANKALVAEKNKLEDELADVKETTAERITKVISDGLAYIASQSGSQNDVYGKLPVRDIRHSISPLTSVGGRMANPYPGVRRGPQPGYGRKVRHLSHRG
ncbi:hypothetical protein H2203_003845 [Taxawa tesnikishii (nom. ined.)]|nr:hypothetical protein H2203_003845 [Dothideales sp. JES 119]